MSDELVLPEYRPTLAELVGKRTGLRARTTMALFAAVILLFAFAVVIVRPSVDRTTEFTYDGTPTFELLYAHGAFDEVAPQTGELVRLEGRRGRVALTLTVRPLSLPPARGDAAHALLPVHASTLVRELRAEHPDFRLRREGKARVNNAIGYQVRFRAGRRGDVTFGRDVLVLRGERTTRGALLLSLRRRVTGRRRLTRREQDFANLGRGALTSFAYSSARS